MSWFTSSLATIAQKRPELAGLIQQHTQGGGAPPSPQPGPYPTSMGSPMTVPPTAPNSPQGSDPNEPDTNTLGSILKPSESLRKWAPWMGQPQAQPGQPPMSGGGIGGGMPQGPQGAPMATGPVAPPMTDPRMAAKTAQQQQMRMVRMRSPDGEEADIPEHQVEHFQQKGAQIMQAMGGR